MEGCPADDGDGRLGPQAEGDGSGACRGVLSRGFRSRCGSPLGVFEFGFGGLGVGLRRLRRRWRRAGLRGAVP